jgi:TolB-like protein/DNA-binding winged helix-turn-helix (wHTH) protein/Flp pilus assembly protein TadD
MGANQPVESVLAFHNFELDLKNAELRKAGVLLKVRPQAFRALTLLAERPGETVTREEIAKAIWGDGTHVDFDQGLNSCIGEIRATLSDNAEMPRCIQTVPRRGYRFIAPVRRVGSGLPSLASTTPPGHPSRRYLNACALVVLLLALGGYAFSRRFIVPHNRQVSIAVLPFLNLSSEPDTDYFSDGLTEELIHAFANVPALRVISQTSSFALKDKRLDLVEIGARLKVGMVVEGSVRKSGDQLRITAQLIELPANRHLWSEVYVRTDTDLFTIQNEIARSVLNNLKVVLPAGPDGPPVKRSPPNVDAYNAYLRGRYFLSRLSGDGSEKANAYFLQAVDMDPSYAQAYAGLADSYVRLRLFGRMDPKQAYTKAESAAATALRIDDRSAEAHSSLGAVKMEFDMDWPSAENEFNRAIALNPNYVPARRERALFLVWRGRSREALAEIMRARDLDPLSLEINYDIAAILLNGRDYDGTIGQCLKLIEMDPTFVRAYHTLGRAYLQKKKYSEGIVALKTFESLNGARHTGVLGYAYAAAGRRDDATRILGDLRRQAGGNAQAAFGIAQIYAILGDRDQAFAWLQKAYADRAWMLSLKVRPEFDNLRGDPRFTTLLHRAGLAN